MREKMKEVEEVVGVIEKGGEDVKEEKDADEEGLIRVKEGELRLEGVENGGGGGGGGGDDDDIANEGDPKTLKPEGDVDGVKPNLEPEVRQRANLKRHNPRPSHGLLRSPDIAKEKEKEKEKEEPFRRYLRRPYTTISRTTSGGSLPKPSQQSRRGGRAKSPTLPRRCRFHARTPEEEEEATLPPSL